VNAGPVRAARLLQVAANKARPIGSSCILIDGKVGPKTLGLVNACDSGLLLTALCQAAEAFYLALIAMDPTQERFRNGWLKRAWWPLHNQH